MKRLLYRREFACFYCGRFGSEPCAEHQSGGVIPAWRARWWWRGVPRRVVTIVAWVVLGLMVIMAWATLATLLMGGRAA